MGEFAGVFDRARGAVDPAMVGRLERALTGAGRVQRWADDHSALFYRAHRDAEIADGLRQPVACGATGVVVADVALDDRGDTTVTFGSGERRRSDAEIVAATCARWGADAPSHLCGGFSYAHWDADAGRLILARDPIGSRTVFYVERPGYIVFASHLQILLTMPEVPRDLDEFVLAQMMTMDRRDAETTLYSTIRAVPPGTAMIFTPDRTEIDQYWSAADIAPVRFARDEDYVEAGREIFYRAVASRVAADDRIATTLSGGLDSAAIAATLAMMPGRDRIPAYHRAPAAAHPYVGAVDELALVRQIAALHPRLDLHVIDRPSVSAGAAEPEWEAGIAAMPRLGGVNGRWFDTVFDDIVKARPDILLLGDSGNATLSWNGVPQVAEDLVQGRFRQARRGIARIAAGQGRSFGAMALRQIVGPLMPLAARRWRQRRVLPGEAPWTAYALVSPDFLRDLDYAMRVRGTGHDVPSVNRKGDFTERRLAHVRARATRDGGGIMRRRWQFEVRDPFADRRLVEFALGVPQAQYWHAGEDRWLARRMFADRLPLSVTSETRRGLQCPEWFDDVTARREDIAMAIDRIERSPLAARVIDIKRMKQLLDDWPADADAAKGHKQILGHALQRAVALGGFLRWHEGGNG